MQLQGSAPAPAPLFPHEAISTEERNLVSARTVVLNILVYCLEQLKTLDRAPHRVLLVRALLRYDYPLPKFKVLIDDPAFTSRLCVFWRLLTPN